MTNPEQTFFIGQGDRLPSIVEVLRNADGTAMNLTGCTVSFQLWDSTDVMTVNQPATIVGAPANGQVQYDWLVGDTATRGSFYRKWIVVNGSGKQTTVPNGDTYPVLIQ